MYGTIWSVYICKTAYEIVVWFCNPGTHECDHRSVGSALTKEMVLQCMCYSNSEITKSSWPCSALFCHNLIAAIEVKNTTEANVVVFSERDPGCWPLFLVL